MIAQRLRNALPRLPKKIRKLMTAVFLQQRSRQEQRTQAAREGAAQQDRGLPTAIAWPPVESARELADLWARLQWFLPSSDRLVDIVLPTRLGADMQLPPPEGIGTIAPPEVSPRPMRVVSGRREQQDLLRASRSVLVWRAGALLNPQLLNDLVRCFLIDPEWYSLVEQLEWTEFYRVVHDPEVERDEARIARSNLVHLQEIAAQRGRVNVCGNGPSMREAMREIGSDDFNIVCNTAVQSQEMMEQLRPAVLCFANAVFFGPSEFARQIIAAATQCVERYGSVIATPGGYAQHILGKNYPALRTGLLGLEFQDELTLPDVDSLRTGQSSNVATALMVPIAAALKRPTVHIYGCDGGEIKDRGRWSPWQYFAGAEPERAGAPEAHPAFFRDRVVTEQYFQRYYSDHCRHFEDLLQQVERKGMSVIAETPSGIPALANRYRTTGRPMDISTCSAQSSATTDAQPPAGSSTAV